MKLKFISLLLIFVGVVLPAANSSDDANIEYPLCNFNKSEEWKIIRKNGATAELEFDVSDKQKTEVAILSYEFLSNKRNKGEVAISSEKVKKTKFSSVKKVKLILKGNGIGENRLYVRFSDANGKTVYSRKPIYLGTNAWTEATLDFSANNLGFLGGDKNSKIDKYLTFRSIFIVGKAPQGKTSLQIAKVIVSGVLAKSSLKPTSLGTVIKKSNKQNTNLSLKVHTEDIGLKTPILPCETKEIKFIVENLSTENHAGHFEVVQKMILGKEIAKKTVKFAIDAKKRSTFKVPLNFSLPGIYNVSVSAYGENNKLLGQNFQTINVWIPAGNKTSDNPETFFGAQQSFDAFMPHLENDLSLMQKSGVKIARFILRWKSIEREQGKYNWKPWDAIFEACAKYNIIPYPFICRTPKWAYPDKLPDGYKTRFDVHPAKLSYYTDFVAQLVQRYGKYTKYWEIWNEPNASHYFWGGNADDYLKMLKESSETIKKIDPEGKIVAGGLHTDAFTCKVIKDGYKYFDIFAFHCHSRVEGLQSQYKFLEEKLSKIPEKKPVWLDETGYPTHPNNELEKSATNVKKMCYSRFRNFENYTFFIFRHLAKQAMNPTVNYMALGPEGEVRPIVLAYNTTVHHLRQSKPLKEITTEEYIAAYEFKRKKDNILVVWEKRDGKVSAVKIKLSPGVNSVVCTNVTGTPKQLPVTNGEVRLVVGANPLFLTANNGTFLSLEKREVMVFPEYVNLIENEKKKIRITINNIYNDKIKVNWKPLLDEELKIFPSDKNMEIARGASESFDIEIIPQIELPGIKYIPMNVTINGNREVFQTSFKVASAIKVTPSSGTKIDGSISDWQKKPQAELDDFKNVLDLRVGEGDSQLRWKGKDDLSAKIFLNCDDKNFYFAVQVKDDIFVQKSKPRFLYEGDSLQFAFIDPNKKGKGANQFGLAIIDGKATLHKFRGEASTESIHYAANKTGNYINYEVAIPYKNIGIDPKKQQAFLFSILVNDNDGLGRKTILEWGKGIHKSKKNLMKTIIVNE
jgi:cellulose/xylan binding protein with CBM9 domain/glycosyl hydrolase family 39 (putative alpha-L-iduronidase)